MKENLIYIMSPSVNSWLPSFSNVLNSKQWEIRCMKEATYCIREELNYLSEMMKTVKNIYILSSHRSLCKDIYFAKILTESGYLVHCQTETAVQLGVDKIQLKHLLVQHDLPTPEWDSQAKSKDADCLIKKGDGTETIGIKWCHEKQPMLAPGEYLEKFIPGKEYSVNVFSKDDRAVIFPIVYKGRTTKNLVPPYKRLRCCGPLDTNCLAQIREMQNISAFIASIINNYGFMEVEFIVGEDGTIYVLEVNPRISGTLRISALAANTPCFDLLCDTVENEILQPVHTVFEYPYEGTPFHDNDRKIYCTSRTTFVASSISELQEKLQILSKHGGAIDPNIFRAMQDAILEKRYT